MTDEIAAVPSNDTASYLGDGDVSEDEFDSWVKRSQADTDAVLAAWDEGVEFVRAPDPPPLEQEYDGEFIDAEIVEEVDGAELARQAPACSHPNCIFCRMRLALFPGPDPILQLVMEGARVLAARGQLESQGFIVVDAQNQPRSSGLVLPSDDAVAWAKRTFKVAELEAAANPGPWNWRQYYGPVTIEGMRLQ